ncbi:MAG: ABC transporter substrate-binding protein, partial [Acidimicrobiaceae bacterium]|nr:ABC transporter substrate-binding protein [Acidimicrobiaceae bacterium]
VGVLTPNPVFDTNPDFYAEGQTTSQVLPAILAIAKQAGAKNLGVIYCAESPQCQEAVGAVKSAGKAIGIPVVYSASISATSPNYTAQCVAAQQAHVSALAVFDVEQPNIKLGTSCSQQGYNPIYLTEGTGFSMDQGKAPGLKDTLWTQYSDLPFWDNVPPVQAMNTAVDKYYPHLRSNPLLWQEGAAQAWPSGLLLEDAIKAGGLTSGGTPSAAEIVKGLHSLHGDTLGGWAPPLTFKAGQPNPIDCYFVGRVQKGTPSVVNNGQVSCPSGASS